MANTAKGGKHHAQQGGGQQERKAQSGKTGQHAQAGKAGQHAQGGKTARAQEHQGGAEPNLGQKRGWTVGTGGDEQDDDGKH